MACRGKGRGMGRGGVSGGGDCPYPRKVATLKTCLRKRGVLSLSSAYSSLQLKNTPISVRRYRPMANQHFASSVSSPNSRERALRIVFSHTDKYHVPRDPIARVSRRELLKFPRLFSLSFKTVREKKLKKKKDFLLSPVCEALKKQRDRKR